ncbi:acyltransferase family protein [Leeia aquatica]|uniref:Acyltransferase n=1 Tax=Leeia aquatica TaxID=2725557 RepID=A0A847RSL5_9NEIS|nr:acyltransferase [Leeia aquatica]NLR74200.1 acyltransferase [Leeia aquatica]
MIKTLNSLEALRFVAAALVILAHSGGFPIPVVSMFLGGGIFLGSIGVDIFFVISGFVMYLSACNTTKGKGGSIAFIVARLLRILPLYAIVTVAWGIKVAIYDGKSLNIFYVLQSLLLLPTTESIDPLVTLGWTLRYEMFFYMLVTIGIHFNRLILIPTLGIILSFIAWLIWGFYYGAPIAIEFIAGYGLAHYYTSHETSNPRSQRIVNFGLVISACLMFLAATGNDWGYVDTNHSFIPRMWIVYENGITIPRPIAWGIPAVLLIYFSVQKENRWHWKLAALGKYTYSIYLLQTFSNPLAKKLTHYMPDLVALTSGFLILFAASFLSHHLFERRIMRLKNGLVRVVLSLFYIKPVSPL